MQYSKTIYVEAFLRKNLGDDLMVRTMALRYPTIRFLILVLAEPYGDPFRDLPNCEIHVLMGREEFMQKYNRKPSTSCEEQREWLMEQADAVVQIGGSIFVQHQEIWMPIITYNYILLDNADKLFCIGSNFGPFTDPKFRDVYSRHFKAYDGVCFRDSYSYKLFPDRSNTNCAPDVVFNYNRPAVPKKKQVVFAPIDLSSRNGQFDIYDLTGYEEAYILFHVNMIRELISRGYSPRLIGFCSEQLDESTIQKIMDCLSEKERSQVFCIAYNGHNLEAILQEFSEAEAVVPTRFHGAVLGLNEGCKILPIIYSEKTEHMLDDFGITDRYSLNDLLGLSANDIPAITDRFLAKKPLNMKKTKKQASRQFEQLEAFLKHTK